MTRETTETDAVHHPAHYRTAAGIEAIDVIERCGLDTSMHLGNAIKYLLRAGRKGDAIVCLRKADWYLARWQDRYQAGDADLPEADGDALLWAAPEEIIAAFELNESRGGPQAEMRGAAVTALLDMATHRHMDGADAVRLARLAIAVACDGRLDGALNRHPQFRVPREVAS